MIDDRSLESMMQLAKRSGCVLELVFVGGFYFGPRFVRGPKAPVARFDRGLLPSAAGPEDRKGQHFSCSETSP